MADQNKIAKTLSAEELARFCERLAKERGVTLRVIADLFEEETGEKVSLMGATSFRDTTFAKHLQRIAKASELADQVRELKKAGSGRALGDAAEALVGEQLIDTLIDFEAAKTSNPDGGLEALNVLSKITKRLTDSERGRTALEHRMEQDQIDAARKVLKDPLLLAAIAGIARDNTLDENAKIAAVRMRLWGAAPVAAEKQEGELGKQESRK